LVLFVAASFLLPNSAIIVDLSRSLSVRNGKRGGLTVEVGGRRCQLRPVLFGCRICDIPP
jgi:hypothetical protein